MEEPESDKRTDPARLKRRQTMAELFATGEKEAGIPLTDLGAFKTFLRSYPALRRWYLARVYGSDEKGMYVDLYYSPASSAGESALSPLSLEEVYRLEGEDPAWWEEEDFDSPVHIPLEEFRQFLIDTSGYSSSDTLEEGMVFLEWLEGESPQLIPFSYQAREASKDVYRRLMNPSS